MDTKKKCVTMKLDYMLQLIWTVLGSIVNMIGKDYVVILKERDSSLCSRSVLCLYLKCNCGT